MAEDACEEQARAEEEDEEERAKWLHVLQSSELDTADKAGAAK